MLPNFRQDVRGNRSGELERMRVSKEAWGCALAPLSSMACPEPWDHGNQHCFGWLGGYVDKALQRGAKLWTLFRCRLQDAAPSPEMSLKAVQPPRHK